MDQSIGLVDQNQNFFSEILGTAKGAYSDWLKFKAVESQNESAVEASQGAKNQAYLTGQTYAVGGFAEKATAGVQKYGLWVAGGLLLAGVVYAITK